MRRLFGALHRLLAATLVLGAIALPTLTAVPPARAAMITEVADAAEKDKPIDINVDLRWRRDSHSMQIGREESDGKQIYHASELSYSHIRNTMEAALTVGLYHDLEFHFVAPYVLSDTQSWNYATLNNLSVEPTSTVAHNTQNADGTVVTPPPGQPLFPVPGTVNRAGFGDPTIGLAWGIFNEQRETKLPDSWYPNKSRTATWVVGLDYTMPLAPVMDPSATTPGNPAAASGPVGEGTHRLDFWTSMSKRFGPVEPFFRLHYTLALAGSDAYDNCSIVGKDNSFMIMSSQGQTACSPMNPDQFWAGRNKLEPSQVGGLLFGTEFHPLDHGTNGQALAIALQFRGDYVSKGRNYSELSDVLHKLTYTDQYFSFDSRLTVDYRFAKFLHWVTFASLGADTNHFLTDETVGIARSSNPGDQYVHLGDVKANEVNPSYDFRMDVPGHRFLAMSVLNFTVSTGLSFNF